MTEPSRYGIGTIMSCGHDELGSGSGPLRLPPQGLVCDLTLQAKGKL